MWSFKTVCCWFLVVALAGCGFRPLYAPPQEDVSHRGVYAFDIFKRVEIANIPNREGQYFRNVLVRLLHPSGRSGVPLYRLNVTLNESTSSLAVQRSAVATRANLKIVGNFSLLSNDDARESLSGIVTSSSGYNIFQSEFQTLMAEKGARERALEDLAQQMRIQLAALLTSSETQTQKP